MKNNDRYIPKFEQLHKYEKALTANDKSAQDLVLNELKVYITGTNAKKRLDRMIYAIDLISSEKYDEAFANLDTLFNSIDFSAEAYLYKAFMEYEMRKYTDCLASLNKIFELCPDSNDYHNYNSLKACCLYKLQQFEEALISIDKTFENNQDSNDLLSSYYTKGTILYKLCRFKEALDCFNKFIKSNPDNLNDSILYQNKCLKYINKTEKNSNELDGTFFSDINTNERKKANNSYVEILAKTYPQEARKLYFRLLENNSDNEELFNPYLSKLLEVLNEKGNLLPADYTISAEQFKNKTDPFYKSLKEAIWAPNKSPELKRNHEEWVEGIKKPKQVSSNSVCP
ncbi:MAG: tetratricopeptide repeat protein [Alphaproteobacteria bacterium]